MGGPFTPPKRPSRPKPAGCITNEEGRGEARSKCGAWCAGRVNRVASDVGTERLRSDSSVRRWLAPTGVAVQARVRSLCHPRSLFVVWSCCRVCCLLIVVVSSLSFPFVHSPNPFPFSLSLLLLFFGSFWLLLAPRLRRRCHQVTMREEKTNNKRGREGEREMERDGWSGVEDQRDENRPNFKRFLCVVLRVQNDSNPILVERILYCLLFSPVSVV